MKNGFTISEVIPAKASEIYAAWLNSEGHAAMTGSPAQVDGNTGGKFTVWDGYIFGRTLELARNQRIVQAWRTSEFPEDAPDSRVEILFEEISGGTKVTLTHSDMPENQVESYRQGWDDFYFKPMKSYFSK
ncbi:MAG TPA: SRPBCC family protein [Anaerolineales bacterium]|jgi:activator of HSP90 ATPase|nr:SRPBCC family protein [Anaerolineales bacterium]